MKFASSDPYHSRTYLIPGIFTLAVNVTYAVAFVALYPITGDSFGMMVVLPPAMVGWLFGQRIGLLGGLFTAGLNLILFTTISVSGGLVAGGLIAVIAASLVGSLVGRLSDRLRCANEQICALRQEKKCLTKEVNQHKQAEKDLQQTLASETNRLKSQLLANVSHEVRTPLNAILGYAELLLDGVYGPISEKQSGPIAEIMESAGELFYFVSNLIDQTRIQSGQIVLNQQPFKPVDLLEKLTSTLGMLAQLKKLEFVADIAPDLPENLFGDPYWVQQILINLAGNAIKFTDQGSVRVYLYQADETHWAIDVSDTGPGISKQDQAYIFEAFQQLDGSITRKQGGSGLGLSIVKQLTGLMGGRVILRSKPGCGSTFTVLLPLNPVQEQLI